MKYGQQEEDPSVAKTGESKSVLKTDGVWYVATTGQQPDITPNMGGLVLHEGRVCFSAAAETQSRQN